MGIQGRLILNYEMLHLKGGSLWSIRSLRRGTVVSDGQLALDRGLGLYYRDQSQRLILLGSRDW